MVRSAAPGTLSGEAGYVEGQNATVEYHWLKGDSDRLLALIADRSVARGVHSPALARSCFVCSRNSAFACVTAYRARCRIL
jgi:hypothetical protein